jgi:hypothetical protein
VIFSIQLNTDVEESAVFQFVNQGYNPAVKIPTILIPKNLGRELIVRYGNSTGLRATLYPDIHEGTENFYSPFSLGSSVCAEGLGSV